MTLKDVINAVRDQQPGPGGNGEVTDIGTALWDYLRARGEAKDERREEGYHPSQMFRFCPRRAMLDHFFPEMDIDIKPPETQMVWDWGTAWHWFTQNYYFGPMGILWGSWQCNGCGQIVHESFMPNPCKECHPRWKPTPVQWGGYWTYLEPRVYDRELQITGHCDGILILSRKPGGDKSLSEIKTIDGNRFKVLREPDESYVFQLNIYMGVLGLKVCWLSYWSKDARQTKPKVFRIDFNPALFDEVKRRIGLHRTAWDEKKLCVGICPDDQCKMAMDCIQRAKCFRPDVDSLVEQIRSKKGDAKDAAG